MAKHQPRVAVRPWLNDAILRYVDMKLAVDGGVNRRDLMEHFNVSIVTASKYFSWYRTMRPDFIRYDPNMRKYVPIKPMQIDGTVSFADVCDMIIPVGAWLEQEHIRHIKAMGGNPDNYTSEFSEAADALRQCVRKVKHGKR